MCLEVSVCRQKLRQYKFILFKCQTAGAVEDSSAWPNVSGGLFKHFGLEEAELLNEFRRKVPFHPGVSV